jgi:hypothetical protein
MINVTFKSLLCFKTKKKVAHNAFIFCDCDFNIIINFHANITYFFSFVLMVRFHTDIFLFLIVRTQDSELYLTQG